MSCGPDPGSKFYVHRVVLSLQSKFFKDNADKDIVEVRDVPAECMGVMIDLAYSGRAELADAALHADVMVAADKLQMSGLVEGIRVEMSTKQLDLIRKLPSSAYSSASKGEASASAPITPSVRKRMRKTNTVASTVALSKVLILYFARWSINAVSSSSLQLIIEHALSMALKLMNLA